MANHRDTHPEYVEGCYACKLRSVNLGGFPSEPTMTEKRWDRDMPAYKAMRADGLQPPSIDGAADLQSRASEPFEVEFGHVFKSKKEIASAKEGIQLAREMTA